MHMAIRDFGHVHRLAMQCTFPHFTNSVNLQVFSRHANDCNRSAYLSLGTTLLVSKQAFTHAMGTTGTLFQLLKHTYS
jgi:hypothetical protein